MSEKYRVQAKVLSMEEISADIFSLWIQTGEMAAAARPGQFVSLYCDDGSRILPRPISICEIDREAGTLRLVFRIAGAGTRELSRKRAGDTIPVVGPLGNGFPLAEIASGAAAGSDMVFCEETPAQIDGISLEQNQIKQNPSLGEGTAAAQRDHSAVSRKGVSANPADSHSQAEQTDSSAEPKAILKRTVFLIGGGIGIPPMLELAKALREEGCRVQAILGYRNSDTFLLEEFRAQSEVFLATEDGSLGTRGNVLDAIREGGLSAQVLCACGPTPMLRALKTFALEHDLTAWLSLEEKMACGIGACLACVCKSTEVDAHSQVKNKRICKEGPVFEAREVEL